MGIPFLASRLHVDLIVSISSGIGQGRLSEQNFGHGYRTIPSLSLVGLLAGFLACFLREVEGLEGLLSAVMNNRNPCAMAQLKYVNRISRTFSGG